MYETACLPCVCVCVLSVQGRGRGVKKSRANAVISSALRVHGKKCMDVFSSFISFYLLFPLICAEHSKGYEQQSTESTWEQCMDASSYFISFYVLFPLTCSGNSKGYSHTRFLCLFKVKFHPKGKIPLFFLPLPVQTHLEYIFLGGGGDGF